MTLKAFQKPSSLTPDLEVLSRAVNDYTQQITKVPYLSGFLLQNVNLASAQTLSHSLGREWTGYMVTKKSGFGDVIAQPTPDDSKLITLQANASIIVDVWVF